ncbi:AraC family transcriptional regulator [Emticicia sp. C21]|uniref:helix-turn-helix domain-containing protein n=1 Tax=Emticicia sp. C21 TaxID=2302915 RepID=UPI000E3481D7|nr:helix-turn-helix domain-containing protein [Emticicia sp. C21]RFS16635.1 AraC family transcriptional regulator [Emticicia sp. C21]
MGLYFFPPGQALNNIVRTYRVVDFQFTDISSIPPKPYPPRPEHCLSFYPKDTETVKYISSGKTFSNLQSVLFGQQNEVSNRYVGRDFLLFQIVFRPGALYRLTGIPSYEITNAYVDAETVFPAAELKEINERLAGAVHVSSMIECIESFLSRRIRQSKLDIHALDKVCNLMLHTEKNLSIDWLAKESCLSTRQYERKFMERMGVSPKYYQKIIRFENAFRLKNQFPKLDWLSIAIQYGYHDYQHLVKDYKAITQQTPNEFHLIDLSSPERAFGDADTY